MRKPALDVTWDDWNLMLDTNLRGSFFVAQAVARGMIARGYGRIINIGSVTSVSGYAGLAPYGASRGGIRQLTMSLADDWGKHGVTVNCLAPGWFRTEQNKVLYEDQEWVEYLVDRIPAEAARPAERSGWSGGVSGLGGEPLRYRADAAGGWRHFDGLDARIAAEGGRQEVKTTDPRCSDLLVLCVLCGAHQVDGDVGFIANDPAVMSWRNVEDVSSFHLYDAAIIHCRNGTPGDHHADVLHHATLRADGLSDMLGPFPARLVGSAADGHAFDVNDFEGSLFEGAHFVGLLKAFQNYFVEGGSLTIGTRLSQRRRVAGVPGQRSQRESFQCTRCASTAFTYSRRCSS